MQVFVPDFAFKSHTSVALSTKRSRLNSMRTAAHNYSQQSTRTQKDYDRMMDSSILQRPKKKKA